MPGIVAVMWERIRANADLCRARFTPKVMIAKHSKPYWPMNYLHVSYRKTTSKPQEVLNIAPGLGTAT
jgi:hypothetical protein